MRLNRKSPSEPNETSQKLMKAFYNTSCEENVITAQLNKHVKNSLSGFHLCPHCSIFYIRNFKYGNISTKLLATCNKTTGSNIFAVRSKVLQKNMMFLFHYSLAAVPALQGSGQKCLNSSRLK